MAKAMTQVIWGGAASVALMMGCAEDSGAVAVTRGQLAEQLAAGTTRVEVELRADGSVREVAIEDELGHEEQLAGRIVSLDVQGGVLEVEHLGTVDFKAAGRYRTGVGNISAEAWLASVGGALGAGQVVWLDARGAFRPDGFNANELRWEEDADRGVKAWVRAEDFDAAGGVLRIGELAFAIGAAPIRQGDDGTDDNGSDDSADDNGTDDNGTDDNGTDDNGTDDSTDDNGGLDDSTDDNGTDDDGGLGLDLGLDASGELDGTSDDGNTDGDDDSIGDDHGGDDDCDDDDGDDDGDDDDSDDSDDSDDDSDDR